MQYGDPYCPPEAPRRKHRGEKSRSGCGSSCGNYLWGAGLAGCCGTLIFITGFILTILIFTQTRNLENIDNPQCFKVYALGAHVADGLGDDKAALWGVLKVDEDEIDWKFYFRDFDGKPDDVVIRGPISIQDNCCGNGTADVLIKLSDEYGGVEGKYDGDEYNKYFSGVLEPKDELKVYEEDAFAIMANPELFYIEAGTRGYKSSHDGAAAVRAPIGTRTKCDV